MRNKKQRVHLFLAGAILSIAAPVALTQTATISAAQAYPSKPIRLIVPYPPGGGADILARALGQKLTETFGQSVVVDNRAGATGIVGTDIVAKAAPDGYTLIMITSDQTIVSSLYAKLPYDLVEDFAPATLATSQPYIMGVHPSVAAKSVKEFIALAKSKPGQLNYASGGNGGTPHLAVEQLKTMAGINMVHVPYKGGGPALLALISGEVAMLFSSLPSTLPQVKAAKVRALAVSSAKRSPAVPELPTVAESGVPGFAVTSWYGILAPAKTPKPIIARLHAEIVKELNTREFRARLANDGTDVVGSTPQAFADFMKADIAKWVKVIKASGVRMD
ncbi:MAG: tripartite tricarboxylate transporter substrate binding protein [Betaproteobacteria bacterium]|nr:tripartite tricarboxylate transporter substrate binding protein [Betaproteobacteria bacterium]